MRVVEGLGDGVDDPHHILGRQPGWMGPQQLAGIDALDVVHRDPQLAVGFAAVVDADDVGMPQRGHQICLAVKPQPVLVVAGDARRQHLERVVTRQPRMPRQIHLTHRPRTQEADDGVPGEGRTLGERHGKQSY